MAKKTTKNPHGLSAKEKLLVKDIVGKVKSGESIKPVESVKRIYNVSSENSARVISSQKMNNPDIQQALIDGWSDKKIIGPGGKIETRLEEGLDATTEQGGVDYNNRLKYIQEINKITGVYAAERREVRKLSLNIDMTEDELDKEISRLTEELED